jgi:NAD(P)-dependent dehydrogenase (short-subunit alcohol dehydrogenase family)
LVAGGASGLGLAVATRFADEGARVAVFDRDEEKLAALEAARGGDIATIRGDITRLDDQRTGLATTKDALGGLDALVVTTGIVDFVDGYDAYDVESFQAAFEEVMAVNVRGPLSLTMLARDLMRSSVNASITFTLSSSAMSVPTSGPVYGLAKSALLIAVKQLAAEFAPEIRVNGVVPGAVLDSGIRGPTALRQAGTGSARLQAENAAELVARGNLVGFAPSGADYAALYVLLASRHGRVATGGVIPWDTGLQVVGHRGYGSNRSL